MTLSNTLKALVAAASLLAPLAARADDGAAINATAAHVVLGDDPRIDLSAPASQALLDSRAAELTVLFDAVLTDAGKQAFYQQAGVVIGSTTDVARLGGRPAVYLLTLGSGDCEAGCISRTRLYYEVNGAKVTKIGETGDLLADFTRDSLFK